MTTKPVSTSGTRWAVWKRYTIAGRNSGIYLRRLRVIQTPFFNLYLHHLDGPDPDPNPHDHPWSFLSLVLKGGYVEQIYRNPDNKYESELHCHNRFSIHKMRASGLAHRIIRVRPETVTLVLAGPRVREWGFWTFREETYEGAAWFQWEEYLNTTYGTSSSDRRKEPMP